MDKAYIKKRIVEILRFDLIGPEGIVFEDTADGMAVNLDCYALTGNSLGSINDLAYMQRVGWVLTQQENHKLQILF